METKEIFEKAQDLFYQNKGRKEVIEYLNSKEILGDEAENLATKAYKEASGKIDEAIELEEHKSLGGPYGKIMIGLFAIGIVVFGIIALNRILYIIFLIGITLIGSGVVGLFNNPEKRQK